LDTSIEIDEVVSANDGSMVVVQLEFIGFDTCVKGFCLIKGKGELQLISRGNFAIFLRN
jgi:hypothetical protein